MSPKKKNNIALISGGGEMGELTRAKDWSLTPVGNPETWPQSLRITLSIILNSRFPMFLFWGKELICFYNDAYRPSLGQEGKHPSILGMKAEDAWTEIWDIIKPLIDKAFEKDEAVWFEDMLVPIYRNGKIEDVYWTFSYSPVIDEMGKTPGVLVTCTETTDKVHNLKLLKESEQRFRIMVETIPEIAWVALPGGPYSYYNKRFYEYTGMSVEQADKDWQWKTIVHPDMFAERNKAWEHSYKTGEDFYFESLLKRHSDQSYRWHISRAAAIKNETGEITLWVGTSTDIHEQKLFSEELESQVKQRTQALLDSLIHLQHSNENLEQYASIASHDLQEPLRKIQTFSSLLQQRHKNNIPDEANVLIDKIKSSSARMSVLINDVLNFSKISHTSVPFVNIDLNEILNNVLVDFELLIKEKRVIINNENLPKIEAIPVQMNQLFYNLLSNAIKFSATDKQPVISIFSKKLLPQELQKFGDLNHSHQYCQIIFADNGIGFDKHFAEEIFLIFHRLNDLKKYSGTGIGLALCKKIVANHHGKIYANGEENEGASFCVILPVKQSSFL